MRICAGGAGQPASLPQLEHDKCLAALLMHRRFFEMAVGGDGLKHFRVDGPPAPA